MNFKLSVVLLHFFTLTIPILANGGEVSETVTIVSDTRNSVKIDCINNGHSLLCFFSLSTVFEPIPKLFLAVKFSFVI